ncbi:7461_t:CDS:10 [Paraglomus brasilianum]|uniref:GPI ethanolamine phosphate transferase 1 n=1 Tax=Paraglomus brasilianum TaxID=144538 RepID=A0A9N9F2D5_9GLOM|nr:7461_t:CDS:10 [Paraglomus brasilianum]
MAPHRVEEPPPPAKRLVLVVADGLRADKLFQLYPQRDATMKSNAPYLRDLVLNHGTWGISHTRVPTESRPGHVALIAGFYEDVSAVTKGWKMNPVEFDSVFNQSEHTWSFGSPDILPMFAEGASDPNRVDTFMYASESEDFAEDAVELDLWVLEKFTKLFDRAKYDDILFSQLHKDRIVFFLHLLGLDTNGHAHLPSSQEYLDNIKVVDDIVSKVVNLMDEFYEHDEKTAYVFTADHGMSNRGNHGDGHPDNTRTPLISWGAGVNKPNYSHPTGHDDYSAPWGLNSVQRNDVLQAGIAPLMASLIGINYPVNSVGELPLAYLNNTPYFKAKSIYVNALEILEQYNVKNARKKQTELMFKPYAPLNNATHKPEILISRIEELIDIGEYGEAEALCLDLIELSLQGLRYLQTYDWLFLRSIVNAGYIGWIMYSLSFVFREYVLCISHAKKDQYENLINIVSSVAFFLLFSIIYIQEMPATYYAYVVFPIFFWNKVLKDRRTFFDVWKLAIEKRSPVIIVGCIIGYLAILQMLVLAYFYRSVLNICFLLAAIWPLAMPKSLWTEVPERIFQWVLCCLCCSVFTLLPVEKGEDITLVLIGGLFIMITGLYAYYQKHSLATQGDANVIGMTFLFQLILVILSMITVYGTASSLRAKTGLPTLNKYLGWAILVISILTPFVHERTNPKHYAYRLISIYLSFAPLFVILSISYEVLFYCIFSITLWIWLALERHLHLERQPTWELRKERTLTLEDLRISLMFLFFMLVAFFGTGNVASLSSFSLQSVYRLTTVFDPFLMGALLLLKLLIPFFIVTSAVYIINKALGLPSFSLCLLVISTSDVMTLNFFYLVRDDGSWLEIGTSISHFCISSLFVLFIILLYSMTRLLVGKEIIPTYLTLAGKYKII